VTVKKRGHQFHPKNIGTRKPVAGADEAIRILRGDAGLLPTTPPVLQENVNKTQSTCSSTTTLSPQSSQSTKRLSQSKIDFDGQHTNQQKALTANAACDETTSISQTESNELISSTISSSSSSSTVVSKKKKKSDGEKKKSSSSEHKRRKVKGSTLNPNALTDITKMVRPAVEGAASDERTGGGEEEDPEAAEWAKLRCTSERTEVVAEREQRRQRRCADYPGLAFGRSVFSSDTMMKFNIIRNELHNIVNTQIKRVGQRTVRKCIG
jgi:hypothetical protein